VESEDTGRSEYVCFLRQYLEKNHSGSEEHPRAENTVLQRNIFGFLTLQNNGEFLK